MLIKLSKPRQLILRALFRITYRAGYIQGKRQARRRRK